MWKCLPAATRSNAAFACASRASLGVAWQASETSRAAMAKKGFNAQCTSTGYVPRILKNPQALRSSSSAWRTFSVSGWPAMSM